MEKEQKETLIKIILSVVLTVAAAVIAHFFELNRLRLILIFALPYLIAGYETIFSSVKNIFSGEFFDEEFLMTVATIGAFAIGDYTEGCAVMIFYLVGELFEDISLDRSKKSISALLNIRPDSATVIRDGKEAVVSPEDVGIGEIISVKPGEKIPLDGEITEGASSLDVSALTGESIPYDIGVGDNVSNGTVNLSGPLKIRVKSIYSESTVSKMLDLIENSVAKKAKSENFITKFARVYTPCVVIAAVILAIIPPFFDGGYSVASFSKWASRALNFLVVSCPCAIVVSVPLGFFCGIGSASKAGILIKGSSYIEALAKADTAIFDKTGTLTEGSFSVEAIHSSENIDCSEADTADINMILDIAACAESYSTHPVALSVIKAHSADIDKSRIGSITELAGMGLEAVIDEKTYYVGNERLMKNVGAEFHKCRLCGTVIHISEESRYLGHIVINDSIKPESKTALEKLKKCGITKTVMLTGDSDAVASRVANEVGVDEYHASLLPENKVSELEKLISDGRHTVFVGDGINDAAVIARADVGIAMGVIGSDASIESADVILMDDNPEKLATAINISRRTIRTVKENIVFSICAKLILLALSAFGMISMWLAVFGDVGLLILAVLNSMKNGTSGR